MTDTAGYDLGSIGSPPPLYDQVEPRKKSVAPKSSGAGDPVARMASLVQQESDLAKQESQDPAVQTARQKLMTDAAKGTEPIGDKLQAWDAAKETAAHTTDPLQSFGSAASIFAVIASAFTRTPARNAMNGMAAAINAVHAGDEEGYKRAYEAWKANTDLMIERHNAMHEDYEDALKGDETTFKAAAAKYDDPIMRMHAEIGDWQGVAQIMDSRQRLAVDLQEHAAEIEEQATKAQALRELKKDPAFAAASPIEKVRMIQGIATGGDRYDKPVTVEIKDKDGKLSTMLAQQEKTTGQWVTADESRKSIENVQRVLPASQGGKSFTPEMSELQAALAERGVTLPVGFRAREQQLNLFQGLLDRYPDKSPDEIADALAAGQIEFQAEKKAAATAATIEGKVEVAEEEIKGFSTKVLEQSDKVPRGNFVPINRLIQTADSAISDPNLKQLKIYVNGLLNAYDVLAGRGGTDVEKRDQARSLILTADGPDALKAGVDAFKAEASLAQRAADKAIQHFAEHKKVYKSKEDVVNAYKAGVLDYDEAEEILVEKGWDK